MTKTSVLLVVLLCAASCDSRPAPVDAQLGNDARLLADALAQRADAVDGPPSSSADATVPPQNDGPVADAPAIVRNSCCPDDVCEIGCGPGGEGGGCPAACVPVPCSAIPAGYCPLARCQLLTGCGGQPVCYYRFSAPAPACGGLSYYGQDVACCDGLVKRCGAVLPDGSCSSTSGGYQGLPQCLACGDGDCDQLENKCNCPQDCAQ